MNRTFKLTIALGWFIFLVLLILLLKDMDSGTHPAKATNASSNKRDVVTFWSGVIVGSPEERVFKEVVDEYNRTHPDVHIRAVLIPYATYIGKINIAIATGQPPDICWNAHLLLEQLKVKRKVPDLAIPIPDDMLTPEVRKYYGDAALAAMSRDGEVYAFPDSKYLMGGTFLADAQWFDKAGIDVMYYLRNGWDYKTFREAMKQVQAVMRKEGGSDTYAFGVNLRIIDALFFNNLMYQSLGKDGVTRGYMDYDYARKRYVIDPNLTVATFEQPLQLVHDMIYVDGTWGKKFLGMEFSQLVADLETNDKLAATLSVTMGVPVSEQMVYNKDYEKGTRKRPIKMVMLPVPTPTISMPRTYVISATGYGVLKQMPYKGDAHTRHALDFARHLTTPEVLAKFFVASHRRMMPWPNEDAVRAIFGRDEDPILTDKWLGEQWDYYTKCFDMKDNIAVVDPNKPIPDRKISEEIGLDISSYLNTGKGRSILEDVIYDKRTPRQAAKDLLAGIATVIDSHY